jgi:hypothetical protein
MKRERSAIVVVSLAVVLMTASSAGAAERTVLAELFGEAS